MSRGLGDVYKRQLPLLVSNIMRRKAADLVLSSAKGAAEAKEEKTEE